MTREERQQCEMFRRVQAFGRTRGKRFSKASAGGKAFARLTAAVADIERFTTARVRTHDDGATVKAAARTRIVERLREVRRTARLAALDTPDGATTTFRVPAWGSSDTRLIAAARAVIRDGRAVSVALATLGLPRTFVEELERLVDQFVEADNGQQAGLLDRAAARAGFEEAMARALKTIHTLDVVIANTFKKDAMALAEWEQARHWKTPRGTATDTPPTPPPAPPAPPAPVVDPAPAPDPTLRKVS